MTPGDDPLRTLARLPDVVAGRYGLPALVGRATSRGITSVSAADFARHVRELSVGLVGLGLQPGDRVALLAESRPEWLLADLAVLAAGGITTPIYPTLSTPQIQFIVADAGARLAIVSTPALAERIRNIRHQLPDLEDVLVMDLEGPRDGNGSVRSLRDVIDRGRAALDGDAAARAACDARAGAVSPDDLATIIYTSGTTGPPKGVMLTHRNLVSNLEAAGTVLDPVPGDLALSFLPLSHAFERLVVYLYLHHGVPVVFAESVDTVARDLLTVRPTLMTGVPRVFEKIHARVLQTVAEGSAVRQRLFGWGVRVGLAHSETVLGGRQPSAKLALQHRLADRLVFRKIRARTGGRLRLLVSGSAPLPKAVGLFFHAVGLTIIEGYGLTETSPVLTVNRPDAPRFGTVGKPIPGVEVRIETDGEIIARGPNVMAGYWRNPAATQEVLKDGWIHTGDVGRFDEDGHLVITDRKKDLLVTSGGKKVAPQPIEALLRSHPLVAEALVIGEGRRFPAALLVPNFEVLTTQLRALGIQASTYEALTARPEATALYQEIVDSINRGLAQFERIKKIAVVPAELTIEQGELTPTLKVRRNVVEERWKDLIEEMYRG